MQSVTRRSFFRLAAVTSIAGLIAACGRKGPLQRPSDAAGEGEEDRKKSED